MLLDRWAVGLGLCQAGRRTGRRAAAAAVLRFELLGTYIMRPLFSLSFFFSANSHLLLTQLDELSKSIGKNNITRTVQAESSKFASVLFDQGFQIWVG